MLEADSSRWGNVDELWKVGGACSAGLRRRRRRLLGPKSLSFATKRKQRAKKNPSRARTRSQVPDSYDSLHADVHPLILVVEINHIDRVGFKPMFELRTGNLKRALDGYDGFRVSDGVRRIG